MEIKNVMGVSVRNDGEYPDSGLEDARSFTIMSHVVVNGRDLYQCSFTGMDNLINVLKGKGGIDQ